MKKHLTNIIISRTDSIGDVVLTLPVAKALKDHFPGIFIGFMGKAYTKAVIEACEHVDQFIDVDHFFQGNITLGGKAPDCMLHVFPVAKIAKRAKELKIPLRIGTTNRLYHWFTCNRLVKLSRRQSDLHEAQLNLALLSVFSIRRTFSLAEIGGMYGLNRLEPLNSQFAQLLSPGKYNLILHPKSQGSGREWGLDNFISLIRLLDKSRYNIFVSGTQKERALLQPLFDAVGSEVTDICGIMSLSQFIAFIKSCDGLVASGTGPLHIAAAMGIHAFGIFPPIRPIHPGRWAPIGTKARFFVSDLQAEDTTRYSNVIKVMAQTVQASIDQSASI